MAKKFSLRKTKTFVNLNSYDYSWFAREMTEQELYTVNGGSTVEDTHTVQSGDTLGTLVYNYNQANGTNLTVQDVAESNGIEDPNLIYVGQTINFGNSGGDTTTSNSETGNTSSDFSGNSENSDSNSDTLTSDSCGYPSSISSNYSTLSNSNSSASVSVSSNPDSCSYTLGNTTASVDSANGELSVDIGDLEGLYQAGNAFCILADRDYTFIVKYGDDVLRTFTSELAVNLFLNRITTCDINLPEAVKGFTYTKGYERITVKDTLLENEESVKSFLSMIQQNPDDFSMVVYKRKALRPGFRNDLETHSLYVIEQKSTKELFTLSFNGTTVSKYSEGAWGLNTEKDVESLYSYMKGYNIYNMSPVYSSDSIDVQQTATNIINTMNSSISYYLFDHIFDKENMYNCNTAIDNTVSYSYYNDFQE